MNAKQNIAMELASCHAPLVDTPTTPAAHLEQRAKNLRAFQAKYDAMLYIVEFIGSYHLPDPRNPRQAKEMADLKSLVAQARNGLDIFQPG